jgi:tRNA (guanine37-N1)-methyltransferase
VIRFDCVTLFPEMFAAVTDFGITRRALEQGRWSLALWNPRDFTGDNYRTVDDRPYGGGPGMVLKVEPLRATLRAAMAAMPAGSRRVFLAADGRRFDQGVAREALGWPGIVLLAGRYEGVDQRLIDSEIDAQWSIGDYVLSGGELPALVVIDVLARLLPGTLGSAESAEQESFSDGLLDWPHYTRPAVLDGMAVPAVLVGGDHEAIRRWRLREALGRTWRRRPDLLERRGLSDEERALLEEFKKEVKAED